MHIKIKRGRKKERYPQDILILSNCQLFPSTIYLLSTIYRLSYHQQPTTHYPLPTVYHLASRISHLTSHIYRLSTNYRQSIYRPTYHPQSTAYPTIHPPSPPSAIHPQHIHPQHIHQHIIQPSTHLYPPTNTNKCYPRIS